MIIKARFIETAQTISAKFVDDSKTIPANFGEIQTVTKYIGGEKYEGSYVVTPKVREQTLHTANKSLENDVTIKEIPFFKVSNNSGGNTVYIGNEV